MLEAEIKKNLSKCSRCGLCSQNCPVYNITKNENNTARGLICKLKGFEEGFLNEDEIKSDLKICLNCSKCKSNCPSGVDTTNIFAYKNALFSPSKFSQRLFLELKLLPVRVLYFLNFFKKSGKSPQTNVVYFKGCLAKAQHKNTYLDRLYSFSNNLCCGLPYLASGDIKNYKKAKEKNLEIIKKASRVVFDCASCKSMIEQYEELDEKDKSKLVFFVEELEKKYKVKSKYKNKTVTFHKPCHMTQEDYRKIEQFLSNVEGINFIRLENPDTCCGFGGSYFIFHPLISAKIALKKAQGIKASGADLILSACPSCTMGLRAFQIISGNFKKTLELRDFIGQELVEI